MMGKIKGKRRKGRERMRWLDSITDSVDMNLSKPWRDSGGQGSLACCSPWGCKESDMTEQLNNNKRGLSSRGHFFQAPAVKHSHQTHRQKSRYE